MGDRFIDVPGLCSVAWQLEQAALDIGSAAAVARATLEGVGAAGAPAWPAGQVGLALELSARDLRRRHVEEMRDGLSVPATQIDPDPVRLRGIDGYSEEWRRGAQQPDDEWLQASVLRGEWRGQAAVRQSDIVGPLGTFSASALVAEAQASGRLGFDNWGLDLGGRAEIGLFLAQVEYGLDTAYLDIGAEAFVGGEASIGGEVDFDVFDGDAGFEAGVDAFFGMAAAGQASLGSEAARVVAGGEVGVGIGVDVDAAASFDDGVLDFDFGASAFLGVGGGFDVGLEIDLGAAWEGTVDVFESATSWIGSLWP